MEREVNFLSVAELDVVAGGRMDCGHALGKFYNALSDGMAAIGNCDLAIRFAGAASNYNRSGC